MEVEVAVQCRESDRDLVESVFDEAGQTYKTMMKEQCAMLKGNEPPLNLSIDERHWLPEYVEGDSSSCIGGIKCHARNGRIVVSNTIEDRLDLCFQEAVPTIRALLFG